MEQTIHRKSATAESSSRQKNGSFFPPAHEHAGFFGKAPPAVIQRTVHSGEDHAARTSSGLQRRAPDLK